MELNFSDIVEMLGNAVTCSSLSIKPELDPKISGIAPIDEAASNTLSYIEGAKFAVWVGKTGASALILPLDERLQAQANERGIAWIGASEPRLVFAQAIALFYKPWQPAPEIHPTAVIHPDAQLGKDVYIGAHAVVQAGVKIGDRVCIHANVVIYPDVHIGDRTVLHANCTIHERTRIGADCVIHSGVVIGGEGFGFVPTPEGWLKMEQSGCTVLEDGVEVGCNSTIDRPAVGETRIGRNTKIDNLVQIGHGCQVGENCAIAAQVGLAGGVKVGNRVILAGQVGVANQAKIGEGAIATAKTGIHNDVEPGAIVSGTPAVPHKVFLKVSAIYNRLPEMYQTLKRFQRQKG
ncbi:MULTISPECIES: UDP-3-O-(3-hydroxymyristoyl)glucosamine N-acyltransferase [unclassified Coleofasciculus]|uniref:UDP-3-O-(3-hydroxymyristoyl)glucosamine N-acyltransferase n=1 Tax=unclassified Coleofasciculus TaxID=2692782 RepID=UPI00187DEF27|nr:MULTISPECIES: UDP-3-O-(3-hydroxymyristoyl)glucosamine N-acyltransferase [unclassified Coleofasciculus]MBE9129040.1 UDP-3-O-(3-hydroxymyristoyl)glucosamine N-acyltransferase [Coleofasciculus sp. LEGE 07081]MBE9151637.1 UDP-3-O-(3-hydroxymyristoyl)glucosamine N-acyltransferase [Coleofasciculus sp. LEGE 07092]